MHFAVGNADKCGDLVIHFTLVGGRVLGSNVSVGQCLTENQLFDESVEESCLRGGTFDG